MVASTARDIADLDEVAAKYGDAILPIRLEVTDRVDALGGTIEVASPVGAGTTLLIRLPIDEG